MKRHQGFTLIEMTVVIVLIGMMMTLGLAALNSQMAQLAISATKKKQDVVRDAMVGYLRQNKRLPCPDLSVPPNGFGDDDRQTPGNITTQCAGDTGTIPYADLGLAGEIALDGWENFQTYKVSNPNWTISTNFAQGNPGAFRIMDRDAAGATSQISSNVVAVILSHGLNGLGAETLKGTFNLSPDLGTDESNNATRVGIVDIYKRQYSEVPIGATGAFDDVVAFMTQNDLINPLIQDGSLKSAEGELNRVKADVYNYVASKVLASGTVPAALDASVNVQGPWGGQVAYAANCTSTVSVCTVGGAAYTLTYKNSTGASVESVQYVDAFRVLYQSSLPPASATGSGSAGASGATGG